MMPLSNSRVQLGLALWFPFGACELRLIPLWFPFGPLGFPLVPLGARSPWIPFAPLGYPATGRAPPFVESFMGGSAGGWAGSKLTKTLSAAKASFGAGPVR